MNTRVGVVLAVLFGLSTITSCGNNSEDEKRLDVSGQQVCEMVPNSTIEKALNVKVEKRSGGNEKNSVFGAICTYDLVDEFYQVQTTVNVVSRDHPDVDAEKRVVQKFSDDNSQSPQYEEVPDLGEFAAFGTEPLTEDRLLIAVGEVDGVRRLIEVNSGTPQEGTAAGLSRIAEEMLD